MPAFLALLLTGLIAATQSSALAAGGAPAVVAVPARADPSELLFTAIVRAAPGAPWLRVHFAELDLPAGTLLVATSLADGAQQHLDARVARQWQLTTAYFNGDSVSLTLYARPHPLLERDPARYRRAFEADGARDVPATGGGVARLQVGRVEQGAPVSSADLAAPESICFSPDQRTFSNDTRQGRYIYGDPNGCCTAWMINDANHCFLSAGHCTEEGRGLVEFMVPLSAENGTLIHPPPLHQYIVDQASMQTQYQGTQDWRYFGVYSNSESGLHPVEAYSGEFYRLKVSGSTAPNANLRITGYGENEGFPDTHRRVLKTATGPFLSASNWAIRYRVDTSNGNSGSAVYDETTGEAIGIHTLGGCSPNSGSSANAGVDIFLPTLQAALQSPKGVCAWRRD